MRARAQLLHEDLLKVRNDLEAPGPSNAHPKTRMLRIQKKLYSGSLSTRWSIAVNRGDPSSTSEDGDQRDGLGPSALVVVLRVDSPAPSKGELLARTVFTAH
jgi:hypothetical protein